MAKKLRYGLIGCGGCGVGKHMASYARYSEDVELVAVCDVSEASAKKAAKTYEIEHVFTDYHEMLKKMKLDVVSVATPNAFHAPATIAALQAGVHVHSEKPLATNAAEAQAMVDAKNASGKKLMVGLNNRYTETSTFAKKYVDEGNLGEIYTARCGWRRRRGIPGKGGWFTNKSLSGGGPLIDLGVHFFDLTLFLMGFPSPLSVSAATYGKFIDLPSTTPLPAGTTNAGDPNGVCDVEDMAVGFVKLETGATVSFEFSWASNIEKEVTYFELLGTKGGMRMYDGELKIFGEAAGAPIDIIPTVRNTTAWGENETRHFIDCIKNDLEPLSPPEQAVKMMQIIDATYASSASGREVLIAPAKVCVK
ncbi:MAG TPA: Gfo/Idh/MocA family oxidoreductase [Armatimonadota bacterium]|jgi:predicted dehydrogenase